MQRAGLLAVGLLLFASPALGQAPAPDPARLEYTRAADVAATCPPEVFFRNAVASHLGGGDPFTAAAPKRIKVSLSRPRVGAFAARLELFNAAGDRVGDPEDRADRDCDSLVEEAARHVANAWLVPLVLVRPAPVAAPAPPRAEPTSPPIERAPIQAARGPVTQAPVQPVRVPGVFEGSAGAVRAVLYGLTAGSLTAAAVSGATAVSKGDEARQELGTLVQRTGGAPCYQTPQTSAGSCQQIVKLVQQHDNFTYATIGLAATAAVLGAAATASIWILRTPATPAVRVQPTAIGSLAGLTLEGLW